MDEVGPLCWTRQYVPLPEPDHLHQLDQTALATCHLPTIWQTRKAPSTMLTNSNLTRGSPIGQPPFFMRSMHAFPAHFQFLTSFKQLFKQAVTEQSLLRSLNINP
ncbi:hypothetical protein BpHYR1_045117 [Brachionus plicatilis]|uniref:Uncharacterized protein n=1 Tax=Brachionus plicatilis TaxID=10195 RepID=A0A3M7SXM2_BRAPC|nr:hypothetical protein BpHYR1_045117 [Brachionus plicatilis]